MSLQHINQYYTEIDQLRRFGGSRNENALRSAFEQLLRAYCADKPIKLVNEVYLKTPRGNKIRLDGTLKDSLRQDWGNVFSDEIRVGIAVYFLVRLRRTPDLTGLNKLPAKIFYTAIEDYATAERKKEFLQYGKLETMPFVHVHPDKTHNWIHLAENSWADLLPVATKQTKLAKHSTEMNAIFELFSLGVITARDEWVYDESKEILANKMNFLINFYNHDVERLRGEVNSENVANTVDYTIKWTRAVKNDLVKGKKYKFQPELIRPSIYKPFVKRFLYFSKELNEMQYQTPLIFPIEGNENIIIAINVGNKLFNVLASKYLVDLHFNGDSQCLPLYRYDNEGNRHDNLTDFALVRFREHYDSPQSKIQNLKSKIEKLQNPKSKIKNRKTRHFPLRLRRIA